MTSEFTAAEIKALNQDVEEEVTLEVAGITIVGFAANRPSISVGDVRKVQFKLFTASDYRLAAVGDEDIPILERIGVGFGYRIVGKLVDQGVSVGELILQDESLPTECAYLVGKMVSLEVDRIGVRFLRN